MDNPRLGPAPVFRDKKLYTSRDMAEQAGKAELDRLRGGTVQIDFTMPGRPDIFAERPIKLEGVRDPLDGEWIVKTVTHTFGTERASDENQRRLETGLIDKLG